MLNQETINEFRSKLAGELIEPEDARYDNARKVYNAMIDRRPRLIARCADVADVSPSSKARPVGSSTSPTVQRIGTIAGSATSAQAGDAERST
jgi:hypothetical protein